MKINFERKLYEDIAKLSFYDEKENLMFIGADIEGEFVNAKSSTFKWFTPKELKTQDENTVIANVGDVAEAIKQVINKGADAIIAIFTHPSKVKQEDWVYASLSDDDYRSSKNIELMCNIQGLKFYACVATCERLYFWHLDDKSLKPVQLECYVNGANVTRKVPSTLEEIVKKLQS